MTENIKRLYLSMDSGIRTKALLYLKDEVIADKGILMDENWILEGKIPEPYQEKVVALFQNMLSGVLRDQKI